MTNPMGVDTVLKLILSKSIGRGYQWQRVHLNISWNYNSDAHEDERENYFAGIIGYDRLIGPDTVLVLDFVREQEKEEGRDSNLLEAGIRYRLTPLVVAPHCIMCKRGVDDGRRGRRHR